MSLKDKPRHARDFPEASRGQLGCVEARKNVMLELVGRKQAVVNQRLPVEGRGRKQLEAVVVHRYGERARPIACDAPGDQRTESDMRHASSERIAEEMMTLTRAYSLHDQHARSGQRGPFDLKIEQWFDRAHFRFVIDT